MNEEEAKTGSIKITKDELILKGFAKNDEEVIIRLKIADIKAARTQYIQENKDDIKKLIAQMLKILSE